MDIYKAVSESKSMSEASRKMGMSFNKFKREAVKKGIYTPNQSGKGTKKKSNYLRDFEMGIHYKNLDKSFFVNNLKEDRDDDLVEFIGIYFNYIVEKGLNTGDLLKEVGISESKYVYYLKKCGLPSVKSSYFEYLRSEFNIYSFDKWESDSAYWLGFIAADGYVHGYKNIMQIGLSIVDYNHLQKFSKFIDLDRDPVTYSVRYQLGTKEACRVTLTSKHMKRSLVDKGIKPGKSKMNYSFLDYVPYNLTGEFISGYFDGDGHISERVFTFTGNEKTLLDIADFLKHYCKIDGGNLYNTGRGAYTLTYYKDKIKEFYSKVYGNSSLRLERKDKSFRRILNEYK